MMSDFQFNDEQLIALVTKTRSDKLLEKILEQKAWVKTKKIRTFIDHLAWVSKKQKEANDLFGCLLDKHPLSRSDVEKFCQESKNSEDLCWIAIMAWGGQELSRHRGLAGWSTLPNYKHLIFEIRNGRLSRKESYQKFLDCRKKGLMKGIDAPFFTKLIFFMNCDRQNRGYIFDQWTAKSMKLLCPNLPIVIHGKSPRSIDNSSDVYEKFCEAIENLADQLRIRLQVPHITASIAESIIFSYPRGDWRRYVECKYV
jgi:hypothetical protein